MNRLMRWGRADASEVSTVEVGGLVGSCSVTIVLILVLAASAMRRPPRSSVSVSLLIDRVLSQE